MGMHLLLMGWTMEEEAVAVGEKEEGRLVGNPRTGARVGKRCCGIFVVAI